MENINKKIINYFTRINKSIKIKMLNVSDETWEKSFDDIFSKVSIIDSIKFKQ